MDESKPKEQNPEKHHKFDPELLKKGYRCNLDQYKILKGCSDDKDITNWNNWRKEHPNENIWLQNQDFTGWWLKEANFMHGKYDDEVFMELFLN